MKDLQISNYLIGNRSALNELWERDGYWFFRNVIDCDVIAEARAYFLDHLVALNLIDENDPTAKYNGGPLNNLSGRMDSFITRKVCQSTFTRSRQVTEFMRGLFGCEPFWIPFAHYRMVPPEEGDSGALFDMIHQDAAYNENLPFKICWIPLAEITEEMGGIAVAAGLHTGGCLHHQVDGYFAPIDETSIPAEAWRRSDYRPGDMLLLDRYTPHSGLANCSPKFRLSMDTRVIESSTDNPIVGTVTSLSPRQVIVKSGCKEWVLGIDSDSFCRHDRTAHRLSGQLLLQSFPIGTEVIVAARSGRVVFMRTQR